MRPCLPVSTAFPPVQPIWLTEFSRGDQGAQPVSKQQSYMKDALDYRETEPTFTRAGRRDRCADGFVEDTMRRS